MDAVVGEAVLILFLIYLAILFFFIGLALCWPRTWKGRLKGVALVIFIIVGPVAIMIYDGNKNKREDRKKREEYKIRVYRPAKALFDARCASAKEQIYKTVDDVSGILLMDVRRKESRDASNPHWADAGLPHERSGDDYIGSFMKIRILDRTNKIVYFSYDIPSVRDKAIVHDKAIEWGYSYVDVQEGDAFVRYRYEKFGSRELAREQGPFKQVARYAVSFTNDTNPEDRKHWVAGTTVTITDTLTQEILAEKTWYALAMSNEHPPTSTHGYSWSHARTCYSPRRRGLDDGYSTRNFVDKVLKPKQEY